MEIKIQKLEKGQIEISGSFPYEKLEGYEKGALAYIGQTLEVDGFRKGHVPENILKSKIPENVLLEEMAEKALSVLYPEILEEHKIDAIGRPEIMIVKLAKNNPLEFKIKTTVVPEVKLPNYKKIAGENHEEEGTIEVTEEEIDKTIQEILKTRSNKFHMPDNHVHDESCDHDHETSGHGEEEVGETKEHLPEFNNEFVQSLGDFKDTADFKDRLKDNIKSEKGQKEREKRRIKLVEAILEKTEAEIPELLVNAELDKMMARMEQDISQMGLSFDDYLKHLGKTEDELRKEFVVDAEKRSKLELTLSKIAEKEDLKADTAQVEAEVTHLLEHYKGADPVRTRLYVEHMLTNEKVLSFLEEQKG